VNTITREETNRKVSSAAGSTFKAGNELQTQIDKQASYTVSFVPQSQRMESRQALSSIPSNVDFNLNKSSSNITPEYSRPAGYFDRTKIVSKENQEATADASRNVKKNPSGKTTEESNKEKREKPSPFPASCSSCREETIVIHHR
jgi:Ser-tRNA(Ala) deacylase AlaX